jgi:hypothetical protein
MQIMPASYRHLRIFADLIHERLGVRILFRGRKICVSLGKRPTIYLPDLEHTTESETVVLRGMALHEAGHLKYTDPRCLTLVKDYMTFSLTNWFEDHRIEAKLLRDYPGAKDILRTAHSEAYRVFVRGEGRREALLCTDDRPYDPERVRGIISAIGLERIADRMIALGLPASKESILEAVTHGGVSPTVQKTPSGCSDAWRTLLRKPCVRKWSLLT